LRLMTGWLLFSRQQIFLPNLDIYSTASAI
jgi:hypothetical protein